MNNIEEKMTQLLREEKFHLKSHLISYNQNFPWISLSEESSGLLEEFSTYSWIDKKKDADLLNNDEKLEEKLKREIPSFPQSIIWGLNFQLTPKICQKECYNSSNLIIKREVDFQKLDYNGLIDLFKEIDLPKNKLTDIMIQNLENDLKMFHSLFRGGRCEAWQLEELIVRAIKSDHSKSESVKWIGQRAWCWQGCSNNRNKRQS